MVFIEYYKILSLEDIDGEIWKDVVGFGGYYQVSNFGRVKSLEREVWNKGKNRYNTRACRILKQGIHRDGYLKVTLQFDKKSFYCQSHRLVAQSFHPNPNNLPQVNHKDGIKKNNSDWNLEWVTAKQNTNHAIDLGIAPSQVGERNTKSKLTLNQVIDIKKEFVNNCDRKLAKELAIKYGVGYTAIRKIATGINWRHV